MATRTYSCRPSASGLLGYDDLPGLLCRLSTNLHSKLIRHEESPGRSVLSWRLVGRGPPGPRVLASHIREAQSGVQHDSLHARLPQCFSHIISGVRLLQRPTLWVPPPHQPRPINAQAAARLLVHAPSRPRDLLVRPIMARTKSQSLPLLLAKLHVLVHW